MDMNRECDKLDAFLLGDLDGDEADGFARHLEACAACREATGQQRWLDGLLQSPVRAELEPVPEGITQTVHRSADRRSRRRRAAVGGLAVAATLAVAAGWTVWAGMWPQHPPAGQVAQSDGELAGGQEPGGSPTARPQPPNLEPQPSERITQAVVVGDEHTIVVPVESPYPNVTVVRVYREYKPARLKAPDLDESYPAGNFSVPDYSNGG